MPRSARSGRVGSPRPAAGGVIAFPQKRARFMELVALAGQPHVHTLWQPAAKDRTLQAAIIANRVLTIRRDNVGNRKDVGVVGYFEAPESLHIVFPRSLKRFSGRRIVGIDYELIG